MCGLKPLIIVDVMTFLRANLLMFRHVKGKEGLTFHRLYIEIREVGRIVRFGSSKQLEHLADLRSVVALTIQKWDRKALC